MKYKFFYLIITIILVSIFYFTSDSSVNRSSKVQLLDLNSVFVIFIVNILFFVLAYTLSGIAGIGAIIILNICTTYGHSIMNFSPKIEEQIIYIICSLPHALLEFYICYIIFENSLNIIREIIKNRQGFDEYFLNFYKYSYKKGIQKIIILTFISATIETLISNKLLYLFFG